MPQVTVYIRKEDIEQWEAIEKKSQFIHDALHEDEVQKRIDDAVELRLVELHNGGGMV